MCIMCEGASRDEALFSLHGTIERFGWAVIPVVHPQRSKSWAYTIGLVRFGHPELIILGRSPEAAGHLLNSFGDEIASGRVFVPGDTGMHGKGAYRFSYVNPRQFEKDTFALWVDYYGALGPPLPRPAALELHRIGTRPRLISRG